MRPENKNSLLINGVGILPKSTLEKTEPVTFPNAYGIRMIAGELYGGMRDQTPVLHAGRNILFLPGVGVLILDYVELKHIGIAESRMHTEGMVSNMDHGFRIRLESQVTTVTYASNTAFLLDTANPARTMPTSKNKLTSLRIVSENQVKTIVFATFLFPGETDASIEVGLDEKTVHVSIAPPASMRLSLPRPM
jgi:hypothetical protein